MRSNGDMPTASHLAQRILNTEALLRYCGKHHAERCDELVNDLVVFKQMLAKVLALTAGDAMCAHCDLEKPPETDSAYCSAVCRATSEGE